MLSFRFDLCKKELPNEDLGLAMGNRKEWVCFPRMATAAKLYKEGLKSAKKETESIKTLQKALLPQRTPLVRPFVFKKVLKYGLSARQVYNAFKFFSIL